MYYLKAFNIIDLCGSLNQDRSSAVLVPHTNEAHYRPPLCIKVLLLSVLFLSCYACQKRDYSEELDAIAARLTMIEQRITKLEKMEQRISAYEFQLKELQESLTRLDSLAAETHESLKAIKTQPNEKSKVLHHVVRSGDSLFGIAQEYGLTVAELRRLNNLTKGQVIYPGQRLLLEPESTQ
jgi:LysM repeat protein